MTKKNRLTKKEKMLILMDITENHGFQEVGIFLSDLLKLKNTFNTLHHSITTFQTEGKRRRVVLEIRKESENLLHFFKEETIGSLCRNELLAMQPSYDESKQTPPKNKSITYYLYYKLRFLHDCLHKNKIKYKIGTFLQENISKNIKKILRKY